MLERVIGFFYVTSMVSTEKVGKNILKNLNKKRECEQQQNTKTEKSGMNKRFSAEESHGYVGRPLRQVYERKIGR